MFVCYMSLAATKKWFELNTKLVTNIDNRFLRYSLDIEYKLQEDLESFMESVENELDSIAKTEEGEKSVLDLKPTSDKAFSDSINEFLMENAAVMISANFWALHEIKSHTNPENWEEDPAAPAGG